MCIHHVFDRIGDEITTGKAVEHAPMTHCDAVVNGDGVELLCNAT